MKIPQILYFLLQQSIIFNVSVSLMSINLPCLIKKLLFDDELDYYFDAGIVTCY